MSLLRRLFSTKNTSPVEELETLYKLFKSVNSTSSNLQKYEALVKHPTCHSILKRIYDPHLRHYVTAKTAKKYIETHPSTPSKSSFQSLNELLDALSSRTLSGNAANEAVGSFYKAYCKTPPIQQLFWKVLDRNLKMGVSVQTIRQLLTSNGSVEINSPVNSNKKGTAQNHFISVALATTLPSKKDIFDFSKDTWYVSQKLDGIRCIAMLRYDDKRQKHDISFYSRTGRPFTSLQKVQKNIEKRLEELKIKSDFALDGEICAYSNDNTTNEDFIAALKQVRRINVEMENPVFQVFDLVPLDQFLTGKGATTFKQRQTALKEFIGSNQLPHLKIVEQQLLTSYEQLENMKISAIQLGWEGLIVRKDTPYEGKRTKNMLKVKQWVDAEYIVKSIETGLMRIPASGEDKLVMTNVNIEHKGNTVGVGSGFSTYSRILYAKDPSLIIGKPITVRYFAESKKDDGTISLRFPSVKVVYENGHRDV